MSLLWKNAATQPDEYISHEQLAKMYSGDHAVPMSRAIHPMRREYRDWERGQAWEKPHGKQIEHGGPDGYIEHLKKDISENGMTEPIEIRGENTVYDGHHRGLAAMDLKMDQIPVRHIR